MKRKQTTLPWHKNIPFLCNDASNLAEMPSICAVITLLAEHGPMTTTELYDELMRRKGLHYCSTKGRLHSKLSHELSRPVRSKVMRAENKWFISRRVAQKLSQALGDFINTLTRQ
jgi:hypothetical protein